ncbi:MAG TPA: group 1 truncated hemoglobin [Rhizomicrobium sp.]|jgi:hemoglobin|nr:group 1 truncated hemoglobin [Rhizomicrobium sp.]
MNLRTTIIALTVAALAGFAAPAQADDTLYQDLGGQAGITQIAIDTADNFIADDRIKATFDNTNMDRFKKLLAEQFCAVAGGPVVYTGRDMKASHKALGLTNADFNAVVEDLQKALDKNGIPFATQNRLLARLAPMQHDVVTK